MFHKHFLDFRLGCAKLVKRVYRARGVLCVCLTATFCASLFAFVHLIALLCIWSYSQL